MIKGQLNKAIKSTKAFHEYQETKTKMGEKQYIGMLQGVIFGDWTLQRGPTNDVEKLKEWKKNMEKSIPNNWNDCKIFEIKEANQNKEDE